MLLPSFNDGDLASRSKFFPPVIGPITERIQIQAVRPAMMPQPGIPACTLKLRLPSFTPWIVFKSHRVVTRSVTRFGTIKCRFQSLFSATVPLNHSCLLPSLVWVAGITSSSPETTVGSSTFILLLSLPYCHQTTRHLEM